MPWHGGSSRRSGPARRTGSWTSWRPMSSSTLMAAARGPRSRSRSTGASASCGSFAEEDGDALSVRTPTWTSGLAQGRAGDWRQAQPPPATPAHRRSRHARGPRTDDSHQQARRRGSGRGASAGLVDAINLAARSRSDCCPRATAWDARTTSVHHVDRAPGSTTTGARRSGRAQLRLNRDVPRPTPAVRHPAASVRAACPNRQSVHHSAGHDRPSSAHDSNS